MLETVDSKFDGWINNLLVLSVEEEKGCQLFIGPQAKCFNCRSMEDFTGDEYKSIGLYNAKDAGRFNITKSTADNKI